MRMVAIEKLTQKYSDRIELAKSATEVRRIHKSGKRVALIGMENAFPLGDSSNPKVQWGKTEIMHGGLTSLGEE